MIKSILTAAAFIGLAVPAASAHGVHKSTVITKRSTPIVAVSPLAVRKSRTLNRRGSIAIMTPVVKIVAPIVKVPVVSTRVVNRRAKSVPARNRRVVVRR